MSGGESLPGGQVFSGWVRLLLVLACIAALAPQAAEAGSATAQMRVSITVLPRCQEWNATTGIRTHSTRSCAPGSATLVWHADELSVRSSPGNVPHVIRQADQASRTEVLVVMF